MNFPPESVQVGKCYLTNTGRVRKVIRIMPDGRVQFEHRAGETIPKKRWLIDLQNGRSFALLIEREVPCDWTPETDEATG